MNSLYWEGSLDDYYFGHQAAEILKDRIYREYVEMQKNKVILDVGSNLGLFSLYAQPYAEKIYAIEPAKRHFDCLSKMVEANNFTNITPVNVAISHENTTARFYHNSNVTMYSLSSAVSQGEDYEEVTCVTIEKFFTDHDIKKVDFMKLDVEGAEGKILCSPSFAAVSDKIRQMVVEFHSWNEYNINQILNTLKDQGFIFQRIPNEATLYYFRRS